VRAVLRDDSAERRAALEVSAEIATMPSAAQIAEDLPSGAERERTAVSVAPR
jgi:hypothetical protein